MTTFISTDRPLSDLLRSIEEGKLQLPDFQRGWVWDDEHIRDLLVSIARSFPIGAVMLLQTGGDVRFGTRPVEGTEGRIPAGTQPEELILDGQQRLTTLTQALALDEPVRTSTAKGKKINRHYYFDMRKALDAPHALDEALVAVDEHRQLRSDFGRKVDLDLSTTELECQKLYFPCRRIMNSDEWELTLLRFEPREHFETYTRFRQLVLSPFRNYKLPVIRLQKETSKEAVCLVFEKVNTGGVQLSVFELITASYAAEGHRLREDWSSRKERIEKSSQLLQGIEATEFLQALTLLHTHVLRQEDLEAGKSGKQVRPVSAKRADVLKLPLGAWKQWAGPLEIGFRQIASFLRRECFYSRRELPYSTQLIPLAAVFTHLGERWLEPRIYEKVARWFWSGVLGELYGGSVETRMANDFEDLLRWFDEDEAVPRTVREASFQPDRFDTLRSRLSAAYKGIHVLLLREGAKDWFWKSSIRDLDADEVALDIHHIFPRKWCEDKHVPRDRYDSILNKTAISYRANRKMGGVAPSQYLPGLQQEKQVGLDDAQMDELLASHELSPELLRKDAFDEFIEDRRRRLSGLVERAIGKAVFHAPEPSDYEEAYT